MTPTEIRSAALSMPSTNGEMLNRVQQLRLDNTTAGSKTGGGGGASWLPWVLALFLAITWAGIGIKEYKGAGNIRKSLSGAAPGAGGTGTTGNNSSPAIGSGSTPAGPVAAGTVVVAQKGVLIPTQQIAVSPIDVGGRVVELNVIEGKAFKKGDVLARLEDISYRAQVAESEASLTAAQQRYHATRQRLAEMDPKSVRKIEVDQATAQLDEAKAQQTRTRDELERLNIVNRTGGLSTRELQQAEADLQQATARVLQMQSALSILIEGPRKERLLAAEADMNVAEADVRGAEARLTQARWRLDNCTIRAPIDGVVLRKVAELGNLANPMAFSANAAGGGAICDIANLADMEVDMDIPERDIEKVYPGQQAKVVPDAFKNREYKAVVDRIMPIADDSKSVIKIRLRVFLPPGEVPGTYLKPRMSVNASLIAGEPKKN